MERTNLKQIYSPPETQVYKLRMDNEILAVSGNDAILTGAGVDESEADENGNIW